MPFTQYKTSDMKDKTEKKKSPYYFKEKPIVLSSKRGASNGENNILDFHHHKAISRNHNIKTSYSQKTSELLKSM